MFATRQRFRERLQLAAIPEKRFMLVVSYNPHFALDMMRLLTERVRRNMAS